MNTKIICWIRNFWGNRWTESNHAFMVKYTSKTMDMMDKVLATRINYIKNSYLPATFVGLKDVFKTCLQDMSSRRLQEMSSRCLQEMSSRLLQDVFSIAIFCLPRCLEDVLKTSCKYIL